MICAFKNCENDTETTVWISNGRPLKVIEADVPICTECSEKFSRGMLDYDLVVLDA